VLPIFHQAADLIADPQVRNRGTIGGSLANADPAADWPAVVIAVNAKLEIAGPTGRRHIAANDFFVDIMTTALEPAEVLVAIHILAPTPVRSSGIARSAIRRAAMPWSVSPSRCACKTASLRKPVSASPARPAGPSRRIPRARI